MDVLKSLASPPSVEHYNLLLLIGALVSIVLYPYLGFLLGTSFLSNRFDQRGRKEQNPLYLRFAKNLAETALVNKTVPTVFALLPALSLVFGYAQLLQGTASAAVSFAGFACILLTAAVILLYAYKYTFQSGGLSGAPLTRLANGVLARLAQRLGAELPLIGAGGIMSGDDAAERVRSGAELVQLYTGFIYRGPALVAEAVEAIARQRVPAR